MNGLELSKAYYTEYGEPMLKEQFPELLPFLAVGLCGAGSECFGFDDDASRDHDFEPGFCIFLPDEETVDRRSAFLLERAYAKLPREFGGASRSLMQPVGGARRGVLRIEEFFTEKVGSPDGVLTVGQWLTLPGQALAEATNGEIWFDNFGLVTRIRENLSVYPGDIRRKKLAGHLLLAAQAGQYNYRRCLAHGEEAAAQLAAFEFVKNAMAAIFLLNDTYIPYYKWSFRAMRTLPKLAIEAELFEYLISTGNGTDTAELFEYLISTGNGTDTAEEKYDVIEGICADLIDELIGQDLTKANCGDLEKHAYSVNDGIADGEIRNMHILTAAQ